MTILGDRFDKWWANAGWFNDYSDENEIHYSRNDIRYACRAAYKAGYMRHSKVSHP